MAKFVGLLLILALFAIAIAGCNILGPDDTYSISGRVTEQNPEDGIAGWQMELWKYSKNNRIEWEKSTLTDADGCYCFKNLSDGEYGLTCEETSSYFSFYPYCRYLTVDGKDLKDIDFYRKRYN